MGGVLVSVVGVPGSRFGDLGGLGVPVAVAAVRRRSAGAPNRRGDRIRGVGVSIVEAGEG